MRSSIGWSAALEMATPTETVTALGPNSRRSRPATDARTRSPISTATSLARVAEEDGELLAAVAGRHVVLADRPGDGLGDRAQDEVADGMPVAVVEALEVVDVDHEDAERVIGPPAAGEEAAELVEVAAVRQAGQGVGRRSRLRRPVRIGAVERRRGLDRRAGQDALGGRRPRIGVRRDRTMAPITPVPVTSGAARVWVRP